MWKISLPSQQQSFLHAHISQIFGRTGHGKYSAFVFVGVVFGGVALSVVAVQAGPFHTFERATVVSGQSVPQPQRSAPSLPSTPSQASISTSGQSSKTEVKVNNQLIPIPQNGTVHTTVPGDGSADVSVSINSHSTSSSSSSSSTSISVNSSSQTNVTVDNSE